MPSCDGSNCGACACNCNYDTRKAYAGSKNEVQARNLELEKLVHKLQKEVGELKETQKPKI